MFMNRIFGRRSVPVEKTVSPSEGVEHSSHTWVTVDDLIALKAQASGIQLESINPAKARMAGNLRSRFRGRGMDYQESRGYQPGDDVRHMDWRVTARSGHAHVKVFTEERERPLVLLMDYRPGMFFASRGEFKSVQSAKAAALLAWAAVQRGDRVGALMFNGDHHEVSPKGGAKGALQVIRQLVDQSNPAEAFSREGDEGSKLSEALKRLRRVVKPGSLVFVLSDFSGMDSEAEHQLLRLREHNDVVGIQFTDRLEQMALPLGSYGVTNGHERRHLELNTKASRARYLNQVAERQQRLKESCVRCGVPLIKQHTHEDVVTGLRAAMMSKPRHRTAQRRLAGG